MSTRTNLQQPESLTKCRREYRISKKTGEKVEMYPVVVRCSGCRRWAVIYPSCGLRNCPRCMKKRSRRLERRYLPAINAWKNVRGAMLTFVTLEGVRIDMDNLRASIKKFNDTATDFLKKEYPLAGFGVLEHTTKRAFKALADVQSSGEFLGMGFDGPCTIVQLESQLYLHYHAIVAGPFKEIPGIATRWRSALLQAGFLSSEHDPLQGKHGVNMSVVRSPVGSARYLLKYVSKGVDLSDVEVELLTRLKYVRAWGKFYNPEEPSYDMICRDCGAKCYVDYESEAIEPAEHQKLYIIALERPP